MLVMPRIETVGWRIRLSLVVTLLVGACGTVAGDAPSEPRSAAEVRSELHSKLVSVQERVSDYLGVYSGIPELPSDATVGEAYAAMERSATPLLPILDTIEAAVNDLEEAVNRGVAEGVDIGVAEEVLVTYFDQFAIWLDAHRYQANPNICREIFSRGEEDDLIRDRASDLGPCMAEYLSGPLVQNGLSAAERLNAITTELDQAWR